MTVKRVRTLTRIRMDSIRCNPSNPRKNVQESDLQNLTASIAEHGLLNPIRLVKRTDGTYLLVGGERRFQACKLGGMTEIDALVEERDYSVNELILDQLVDSLSNHRLTIWEQAEAFQNLLVGEGITLKQLAQRVHVSEGTISRALTVRGCLSPMLLDAVLSRRLPAHEAYVIATVPNFEKQVVLAEAFMHGELDRSQLEDRVREEKGKGKSGRKARIKLPLSFELSEGLDGLLESLKEITAQVRKWRDTGIPAEMVGQMWKSLQ